MSKNEIIKFETGQLQKLKNVLAITNKILVNHNRNFHVIQVEWNRFLYISYDLEEIISGIVIKEFRRNELALNYIEQCFKNKQKIDLVITGNKEGVDGVLLAKAIRKMQFNISKRVPIMLLTTQEEINLLEKIVEPGLFDIYIVKSGNYLGQIINYLRSGN